MCLLLETIRVDNGRYCHPGYHQERMDRTRNALFPAALKLNLREIIIPETVRSGIFKCRLIYDTEIRKVEFIAYIQKPIRKLRFVEANNLEYPFKYLDRSGIEQLQTENSGIDEIILVKNGCITDTSFSNLAFLSGNKWFTPDKPLLNGTCRQRHIDQGSLIPIQITQDKLSRYSHISLINAMLDLTDFVLPVESIEI